jgi:transposase-like protein
MSASNRSVVPGTSASGVEVLAKATRRRFSAEFKLKILRDADA